MGSLLFSLIKHMTKNNQWPYGRITDLFSLISDSTCFCFFAFPVLTSGVWQLGKKIL